MSRSQFLRFVRNIHTSIVKSLHKVSSKQANSLEQNRFPCKLKGKTARSRYQEAAEILVLEAGVKEWRQTRRSLTGLAAWRSKTIVTPPPTTLRRFLIVAHECKHIEVGRRSGMRSYEREYECVRAEEEACQRFGFSFPANSLKRNKEYVAYRLKQGLRRGLAPEKVDLGILRWCFDYLPTREKYRFIKLGVKIR